MYAKERCTQSASLPNMTAHDVLMLRGKGSFGLLLICNLTCMWLVNLWCMYILLCTWMLYKWRTRTPHDFLMLCGAVWCSVVQCGAVWCSVVQRGAVCCSVLQCVAVCCSVLQCVAVRSIDVCACVYIHMQCIYIYESVHVRPTNGVSVTNETLKCKMMEKVALTCGAVYMLIRPCSAVQCITASCIEVRGSVHVSYTCRNRLCPQWLWSNTSTHRPRESHVSQHLHRLSGSQTQKVGGGVESHVRQHLHTSTWRCWLTWLSLGLCVEVLDQSLSVCSGSQTQKVCAWRCWSVRGGVDLSLQHTATCDLYMQHTATWMCIRNTMQHEYVYATHCNMWFVYAIVFACQDIYPAWSQGNHENRSVSQKSPRKEIIFCKRDLRL